MVRKIERPASNDLPGGVSPDTSEGAQAGMQEGRAPLGGGGPGDTSGERGGQGGDQGGSQGLAGAQGSGGGADRGMQDAPPARPRQRR